MAMPKRCEADGRMVQGKLRGINFSKHNQGSSSPINKRAEAFPKLSPFKGPSAMGPRTSPGLVGSHYAACKFAEPPLPSALPLPPQHWMQENRTVMLPFRATLKPAFEKHQEVAHQLKLLLKVQA